MAFCSNCGREITEGVDTCPSCGAAFEGKKSSPATWDHTAEFDATDISENKVYALSAYLFGLLGIFLCHILGKESPYAQFHAREALKLDVATIVVYILTAFLFWTCIALVAGVVLIVIFAVVRIIAFVQVCKGQAKEPWLIRSIGALH